MTADHPLSDLLAAYALDALDDDERLEVAEHVDICDTCRNDVDEMLETTAVLALSSTEAPPDALWGRISTQLHKTPTKVLETPPAPVIDLAERRMRRPLRTAPWVAALAGAAAATALVIPITRATINHPGRAHRDLTELAAQEAKRAETRHFQLLNTAGSKERIGEVMLTAEGAGFIVIDHAAALPEGRTYQLWTVVDGKPVSAGLLGPTPTVAAFVLSKNAAAVALSVEDAAGATQPTADPVAVAVLS